MFDIDDTEVQLLEATIGLFAKKSLPFATRATLDRAAFDAFGGARENVDEQFVQRVPFTRKSIQFRKSSRTLNINEQESRVGSIADYMEVQEIGGVKTGGGTSAPIQTAYSAGQEGAKPRTRLPRRANKLGNIKLTDTRFNRRKPRNRKQAVLFAVQNAVISGNRFVYLDLGRTKGIFRVVGGRKRFDRGWPKGAGLKMVADMSRKSVTIPANPWLFPAVEQTTRRLPEFYRDALIFQAKRNKVFGYK